MKQSEIKELTTEQLEEQLVKFQSEYSDLRSAHTMNSLENPLVIRKVRRTIARVQTELTNRALNA